MALTPCSKSVPACDGRPADRDGEPPKTLARDLQLAVRPLAGFEHQRPVGTACERANEPARVDAADLLVAVHEHDRGDRRSQPELVQRTQREHDLDQPALHVGGARAEQQTVLAVYRHPRERAHRPHRVHVPDQKLVRLVPAPLSRPRVEVRAHAVASDRSHRVVEPVELGREDAERPMLRPWLERRRLGLHEPLEQLDHRLPVLAEPAQDDA